MRCCGIIASLNLLLVACCAMPALAQAPRIQIPNSTLVPSTPPTVGGSTLGTPSFDPYAITPNTAAQPSLLGQPPANSYGVNPFGTASPYPTNPYGTAPASAPPPPYGTNPYGNPYGAPAGQPPMPYGNPYGTNPYGAPTGPSGQYPGGQWSDDMGRANPYHQGEPLKLFQNLRLRYTWLSRMNELQGLGINDSEIATTVAFPNFFFTQQPIYISPGFILSQWDGPGGVSADLPALAYSAYVDFDYVTNPQLQLGADLHVRTGVFTDFETFSSRSFRVSGRGLGTFRLSPQAQLKFGVEYINRNDIKLLPAGGVLWTPNPRMRLDIYFPKPKLSMYLSTIGNTEVWGYLAGEYGGGYWTIQRASGSSDRIDINDIRVSLGADFQNGRSFKAFFEGGYVFNREIVYVASPQDNFSPDPTFMLRGGIAY